MSKKKTILLSIGILLASAAVTVIVFLTEPEAKQEGATKKTAMLVDVLKVERGDYKPIVVATGTVQPSKDITLSPRVSGEIISLSQNFVPGSYVKKGEMLLQIDPSDYRNTLQLRKSDLELAKAELRIEMGRQDVAEKDYELIGSELSPENKALVLREPQLETAKANVAAAEASLQQARLNLERTTIKAPFDAHIISRNANVGTQVDVGANLGRLVGMDEYWVIANVPVSKISSLVFSEETEGKGSEVKITSESDWPVGQYRMGDLYRLVGALNNQTRLARVIVRVKDPLLRQMNSDTIPRLMIGSFVEALIEANELQNVIRLNRDYLRKNDNVWVMKDSKLEIRDVTIRFEDSKYAYISEGLEAGEQVVITNLATVVEGSNLRTEETNNTGNDSLNE